MKQKQSLINEITYALMLILSIGFAITSMFTLNILIAFAAAHCLTIAYLINIQKMLIINERRK